MTATKRCSPKLLGLAALVALLGQAGAAHAQERIVRSERSTVSGPNRTMLRSGVWTLGLSYVPAVVVAVGSSQAADKKLYIPVAGPWIDYATRDCRSCTNESLNKALLITDGIFQGIGALQILGSFLFLETRTTTLAGRDPKLAKAQPFQIAPARLGTNAYGLSAVGSF